MAIFTKTNMSFDIVKSKSTDFKNSGSFRNYSYGQHSYTYKPDLRRVSRGANDSIVSAIYNRIAVDVASMEFRHAQLDDNGRYTGDLNTSLNRCLTLSSNIDQTAFSFFLDVALSLMDEGVIAIVPSKASEDPTFTDSYDIGALRTAKIVQWEPDRVKVNLYDENTGIYKDVMVLKRCCAIIENPFYSVMNEPNSIAMRLKEKLALLDKMDKLSSSGKLDLIVQLPYSTKSEHQKAQAQKRKRDIEMQLVNSKYGIAYIDATEKITQLNRPVENNLQSQIEYLTKQLFTRLGMTEEILNGTANETTLLNYFNRIIEPICNVIVFEMKRKFLSLTAITQHKSIIFYRDPFKLVPVSQLADISDRLTRNAIVSSNEIRSVIGFKPSDQPDADELRNKNINQNQNSDQSGMFGGNLFGEESSESDINSSLAGLDDIDAQIEEFLKQLGG